MLTTPQKAELWPTLGPTKLPNFIDVAAAKALIRPTKQTSESEYDDVDEIDGELAARAPEFKSSFGTAIAEAMFNKSLDAAIGASIGSSSVGKKEKEQENDSLFNWRPFFQWQLNTLLIKLIITSAFLMET